MRKSFSLLVICAAVGLSAAGVAGFALLFIPRMNVYWIILGPVIFAVYQIPAVVVYALWKRKRAKDRPGSEESGPPPDSELS